MPKDLFPHLTKRRARLVKTLEEAYDILSEYEMIRLLADDPNEQQQAEKSITEVQEVINYLEDQLLDLDSKRKNLNEKFKG